MCLIATSRSDQSKVLELLSAMDTQIDLIGLQQARENLIHFFDVIDEVWGLRNATKKTGLIYLKQGWLTTLAHLFSDYTRILAEVRVLETMPVASCLDE